MKTSDKYFFCYSTNLHRFLKYKKGIEYICGAKHLTTDNIFYVYEKSEYLLNALSEYDEQGKQLGLK